MEMNFCRRCGTQITRKGPGIYVCERNHTLYSNAAPTAGVFFVTNNNELVLSVRGIEPFKGSLDSFGGFIDDQETAEAALARELQEELGLSPEEYERPVFLSTEVGYYPYEGEERSIISIFFWSRLKEGANPIPDDDVAGIEIVPLGDIDLDGLDNIDVRKAAAKLRAILL